MYIHIHSCGNSPLNVLFIVRFQLISKIASIGFKFTQIDRQMKCLRATTHLALGGTKNNFTSNFCLPGVVLVLWWVQLL